MYKKISTIVDALEDYLVDTRRDFHKYPETGWKEIRTSSIIASELKKIGFDEVIIGEDVCDLDSRMGLPSQDELVKAYEDALKNGADEEYAKLMKDGKTGVIGILRCGDGPELAMRFDIDALPLIEYDGEDSFPRKEGFVSVNHGSMHACGHDGHATIGLGVARTLYEIKDRLNGTIKLIFQPAEEGVRGGKSIVEKGHLDNTKYFLASHITPNKGREEFDLFPGSGGSLATTKIDAIYRGKASHASGAPQDGNNALLSMATAILNLNGIPRHSDGSTRCHVGVANGGTGRNIVADHAKLLIETRGETTEINTFVKNYAERILNSAAEMHGVECEIKKVGEAYSLESDVEMIEYINTVAIELGLKPTKEKRMKLTGSEDVSYMMNKVQNNGGIASFIRLLTPITGVGHGIKYNFDEKVLLNGVKIFSGGAYKLLGKAE
ncbi:MAG: amidohydrolase [Tissierellaceae bacterium]|nr:amidohydrolase [Tissierellaceae bacterium]